MTAGQAFQPDVRLECLTYTGAATMIKAKDCVRSLSPWMVTCLGVELLRSRGGLLER